MVCMNKEFVVKLLISLSYQLQIGMLGVHYLYYTASSKVAHMKMSHHLITLAIEKQSEKYSSPYFLYLADPW